MRHHFKKACLTEMVLLGTLLVGCGGKLPARVTGNVTFDGAPLSVGTVVFHPVGDGVAAYGTIDKNGFYSIQSGADRGLTLGDYIVTVVATTGPPPDGKLITPPRYGNTKESGLHYEVTAGTNRFDIALDSK